MELSEIPHKHYLVQYSVLSAFASISFVSGEPATRKNTVTVQDPIALYSRKDGKFTIRGRDKRNTRTLILRGGTVRYVTYDGQILTQEV